MKKYILLVLMIFVASSLSYAEVVGSFKCLPDLRVRTSWDYVAMGGLLFDFIKEESVLNESEYRIENIHGNLVVKDDDSDMYDAHFDTREITANQLYRPTKYLNHIQFKDLDASNTNTHDGGGMWGQLIISKQILERDILKVRAHYIFQAGDHVGGTVDLMCERL